MLTTTRLTASAIALLAGINLAHAQGVQPAAPHHPATPAPAAKPGAPMTPGAGSPAGMDMGKMMGGGMDHMMPMMRAMRGMMGHGGGDMGMMMVDHVEGRIAFVKAELAITEAQMPQFTKLSETIRANAKAMQAAMAANMASGAAATGPAHGDAMIAMMTARLDAMKATHAAGKELYAVLTDAQKKTADQMMMGRMGGM
jgi:uncharacterized small protein (DUF1192 family)